MWFSGFRTWNKCTFLWALYNLVQIESPRKISDLNIICLTFYQRCICLWLESVWGLLIQKVFFYVWLCVRIVDSESIFLWLALCEACWFRKYCSMLDSVRGLLIQKVFFYGLTLCEDCWFRKYFSMVGSVWGLLIQKVFFYAWLYVRIVDSESIFLWLDSVWGLLIQKAFFCGWLCVRIVYSESIFLWLALCEACWFRKYFSMAWLCVRIVDSESIFLWLDSVCGSLIQKVFFYGLLCVSLVDSKGIFLPHDDWWFRKAFFCGLLLIQNSFSMVGSVWGLLIQRSIFSCTGSSLLRGDPIAYIHQSFHSFFLFDIFVHRCNFIFMFLCFFFCFQGKCWRV